MSAAVGKKRGRVEVDSGGGAGGARRRDDEGPDAASGGARAPSKKRSSKGEGPDAHEGGGGRAKSKSSGSGKDGKDRKKRADDSDDDGGAGGGSGSDDGSESEEDGEGSTMRRKILALLARNPEGLPMKTIVKRLGARPEEVAEAAAKKRFCSALFLSLLSILGRSLIFFVYNFRFFSADQEAKALETKKLFVFL